MSPLLCEIEDKCCMFVNHSFISMSDSSEIECRTTKIRYNIPADYLAKLQVTEKEMKPDGGTERPSLCGCTQLRNEAVSTDGDSLYFHLGESFTIFGGTEKHSVPGKHTLLK